MEVRLDYDYPETRQKADLAVKGSWGLSVFELKCFVHGADSQEMDDWPVQLKRLLHLVEHDEAAQSVAVATYSGYSEKRIPELISRSYPLPWRHAGPLRFFEAKPLQLVVATFSKADHESVA